MSKDKIKVEIKEKVDEQKEVAVVRENEGEVKPIVEMKCPKCKNDKSYFWTMQTRAADESETKFYKCTKCKHTWRDYR
jgi:DNA-directed RNA polymerase subunit M